VCGISGFNFSDKALVRKMCHSISHRGQDGEGAFTDAHVSLGHRRLSIIDLSDRAKQPMSNVQGTVWIVYNGEIYNYRALRQELEPKYKFKSNSDTEVLINAYKEWGPGFVSRLNGMWAFAIYDTEKKIFVLSRDRFGKKPLYYYFDGKNFLFASQPKAIFEADIPRKLNRHAFDFYFTYGYIPAPLSIFENCFKLEPGTWLTFNLTSKKMTRHKYWDLEPFYRKQLKESEQFYIENIRKLLDESVRHRLVADVPVGAFLSGGLDSGAVVATMTKFKPTERIHTFSIGFDDAKFDETKHANFLAASLGTNHHVQRLDAQKCLDILQRLPEFYDEPFADSSMIPTFAVSELARKYVKVSLSGDGGDENFGGYGTYKLFRAVQLYPRLLSPLARVAGAIAPKTQTFQWGFTAAADYAGLQDHQIFARLRSTSRDNVFCQPCLDYHLRYFKFKSWINNVAYDDFNFWLPNDGLVKVDRASMAHNLEVRVPFLDPKLTAFVAQIPDTMKIHNMQGKYIYRKAIADRVPKEIFTRRKMGFSIPLNQYFANEWKTFVNDNVEELLSWPELTIDPCQVRTMLERHAKKRNDYSWFIFSLVNLNLWRKKWL